MSSPGPTRSQGDLAEMLETLLDKGVVVNADVAVTIGDTELLGIRIRAAIASFATAAEYGMAFPTGTDMDQVRRAADLEATGSNDNLPGPPARETDCESERDAGSGSNVGSDTDTDPADLVDEASIAPDPTDEHRREGD